MTKRFQLLLLSLFLTTATCSQASASIFSSLLKFDGTTESLNDNSQGVLVDVDGDDFLSDGDIIYGAFKLETINGSDPSPAGIMAIFSVEITGAFVNGGRPVLTHKPTSSGSIYSVKSLLDDALEPVAFNRDAGAGWDNVLFALLENPSLATGAGTDAAVNPFDTAHTEVSADLIISSSMTAANGWVLDLLGGFGSAALNAYGFADFFHLKQIQDFDVDTDGIDNEVIDDLKADTSGAIFGVERAGLSVLHDIFSPDAVYLGVNVSKWKATSGTTTSTHDVVLKPDGSVQTDDGTLPSQWDVKDDNNFQMRVVPEPASMSIWSGLAVVGALRFYRKRSAAK